MSDNLNDPGIHDRSRINVNEEWEVTYWAEELNCTEAEIREAVYLVGDSVESVKKHLGTEIQIKPALRVAK